MRCPTPGIFTTLTRKFNAEIFAAVSGVTMPPKAGSAVITSVGAITAAYPIVAPFCLAVFLLTLVLTGYVAACAAVTSLALPFIYLLAIRFFDLSFDPIILALS